MSTTILNGKTFKLLLKSGAQFLLNDINRINELNVFPVPDGDTGTNMCMTIQGGIKEINDFNEKHIGLMLKMITKSMIRSARGNSGVILSQYFKGMSSYLIDKENMTADDFVKATESAYLRAYKVVQNPTEGTMLTVMRESSQYLLSMPTYETLDDVLFDYVKACKKSLHNTPNLLPVLKEAGVVDSGGAGFLLIIEGMLLALNGTTFEYDLFKDDEIEMDNDLEVISKKHAIVAVSPGEGISEMFKMLSCDAIVSGGQTMNPSSDDFIRSFKKIDAEYIYVFPNNKNIYLSAKQAAEEYQNSKIIVIPTASVSQCYSALSTYDDTIDNSEEIVNNFMEAIKNVISVSVTYAIRSTIVGGINIVKGDYITIIDGKIVSSVPSKINAIINIVNLVESIDEKSVMTIMYGTDMIEEEKQDIVLQIKKLQPYLEIIEVDGKQDIYSAIIALE